MNILSFFKTYDLEKTFLVGYFGGTNYGDELLCEITTALFKKNGIKNLDIYYQRPELYSQYHFDYGYAIINSKNKFKVLRSLFRSKNIVIGGGGLWGLDVTFPVFVLSVGLLFAALVLRKKVFLLGVGYYSSTNKLGHISAYITAKAATVIIARDKESYFNFLLYRPRSLYKDKDIAFYIEDIELEVYKNMQNKLENSFLKSGNFTLITLRQFRKKQRNNYNEYALSLFKLSQKLNRTPLFHLMENANVDSKGHQSIKQLCNQSKNILCSDFAYNPIIFYLTLKKNANRIVIIAPQYHVQLVCLITGVKFLPIIYDNKTEQLMNEFDLKDTFSIYNISRADMENFLLSQ